MKRVAVAFAVLMLAAGSVSAHCQIPCGIYDDDARIGMLNEHITTIEKSMNEITRLSGEGDKNYNQLVRWVNNKELHADKFMEVVTSYFMAQRIKLVEKTDAAAFADYQAKLTTLHAMLVYAMKCKQTTDLANVEKLRELTHDFAHMYGAEN